MIRFVINNSGRSGVIVNMIIGEFMVVVFYSGIEEDQVRYRILVSNYKIVDQYGFAVIWVYDDFYKMMDIYLRIVRSQFIEVIVQVEQLFVLSNGMFLIFLQVLIFVWRIFQREGIVIKGRIFVIIVRKFLVIGMYVYMLD